VRSSDSLHWLELELCTLSLPPPSFTGCSIAFAARHRGVVDTVAGPATCQPGLDLCGVWWCGWWIRRACWCPWWMRTCTSVRLTFTCGPIRDCMVPCPSSQPRPSGCGVPTSSDPNPPGSRGYGAAGTAASREGAATESSARQPRGLRHLHRQADPSHRHQLWVSTRASE
jgi:hypothetical protein